MTYPIDHLARGQGGQFRSDGGATRDAKILAAALQIAEQLGLRNVTRAAVAQVAGLSVGSISNYGAARAASAGVTTGSMDRVRNAVMRAAIDEQRLSIIAEGLAVGHPLAHAAPDELKARALASMLHAS